MSLNSYTASQMALSHLMLSLSPGDTKRFAVSETPMVLNTGPTVLYFNLLLLFLR